MPATTPPTPRLKDADERRVPAEGRLVARLLGGVLFGLVVYALFALWADFASVKRALADFPLALVPLACGLSFANYLVRFVRWEIYRTRLGIRLDRTTSFLIHLAGLALTVSPGKMGEAFKAWLIRRVDGTPVARSAPIVVAERITDLLGFLVLIGAGGLATAPDHAWVFWATLALCAALVTALASSRANALTLSLARKLPIVRRFVPKLEEALASTRLLLAPRALALPVLLATLGWSLECLAFWHVASALVPGGIPLAFATYTFALSAVAGAVAIIFPGGLGVTEASLTALLSARYTTLGLTRELAHSNAVAATLVIRLCTLWFAVLVGLLATLAFQHRIRKLDRQRATARP